VTPLEWLEYASPESLRLLMYKRIIGARNISIEDVPIYMDEFDDLEEYYFSKRRDSNKMKDARLRGLYEYTMLLRTSEGRAVHVPYRLLAQLATVAPEGSVEQFVTKRLESYGISVEKTGNLSTRIDWAAKWGKRESRPPIEVPEMSSSTKKALEDFAKALPTAKDAEGIQNAAFEALKRHGLKPADFFPAIYAILLGSDRGPRLGPYIVDAGPTAVGRTLLEALAK
jgi:lysyl-tRNA synthetase class 1